MKIKIPSYLLISDETVRKPSVLVLIFSICFAFWFVDFWKPYNQEKGGHNFYWDVYGYYSYLPAEICNNGVFEFGNELADHNPPGPLGTHVPKYTYGMSVMYAPFFALGYKVAYNQKSPLNGFSEPFVTCIHWGSIFYVLLGLFFLRKFLINYFNEMVTAITLSACLFGTMLFHYTFAQSELTHGYLFSLFSVFLFLTHKWHQRPNLKYTVLVGLIIGLITLIRPTEIFIFLFFIFWNVRTKADLKTKFSFFLKHYHLILVILLISILWWIPQLIFYKHHAGKYFYFSYMRERFFWTDPQILNVLLSYRKGWITYTPLIAVSFIGFFFVKKEFPISKWTFFIVLSLILYVLSCWWDWQYGGCFGARSFCQQIAILSVPLASFIEFIYYSPKRFFLKGFLGVLTAVVLCSGICLNMGMSYQYTTNRKIHPWAMTKKTYWQILRNYQFSEKTEMDWWTNLDEPDFIKYSDGTDRDQ